MNIRGKTLSEWQDYLQEQLALNVAEREPIPEQLLAALKDLLELVYEKVPEQQALESVKTPNDHFDNKVDPNAPKGNEGELQTVAVYVGEVTEPATNDGVITFKVTGHRGALNGRQRVYEFVGKELPPGFDLLVHGDEVDLKYRRYGDIRRLESVEPFKTKISKWEDPKYKPKGNPDIDETKKAKPAPTKASKKPNNKPEDDSDSMWG